MGRSLISGGAAVKVDDRPVSVANGCPVCGEDFSSVRGFDKHRVGSHAHGRRCLDLTEMRGAGLEPDSRGRWQFRAEADSARERFAAQIAANDRRTVQPWPPRPQGARQPTPD